MMRSHNHEKHFNGNSAMSSTTFNTIVLIPSKDVCRWRKFFVAAAYHFAIENKDIAKTGVDRRIAQFGQDDPLTHQV